MRFNFNINKKIYIIVSGALFILGIFIILQTFFNISIFKTDNVQIVKASSEQHNIRGWIWSEGIGWISTNCYNNYAVCEGGDNDGEICGDLDDDEICLGGGTCTGDKSFKNCCTDGTDCPFNTSNVVDYGLHYNDGNNELTGWAWSDRVGWICFGTTCEELLLTSTCEEGDNDGEPCVNEDDCPGGECVGKTPYGRSVWACVGSGNDCPGDNADGFASVTGLMSYWKMDGENTYQDDSAYIGVDDLIELPGSSHQPSLKRGKYGNALDFDGDDDYVYVEDSVDISLTIDFTIEAWVKRQGINESQTILDKQGSYRVWFSSDNLLNFTIIDTDGIEYTITQAPKCMGGSYPGLPCHTNTCSSGGGFCKDPIINDTGVGSEWHHVAIKYNNEPSDNSTFVRLYIDGERVETADQPSSSVSLADSGERLYIGAGDNGGNIEEYFNGLIDGVSLWNRNKTAGEIWADAHIEIDGWAWAPSLGAGGWIRLKGKTRGGRMWGSYLNDYKNFYTIDGFMVERHVKEIVDTAGLIGHWRMNARELTGAVGEIIDTSDSENHSQSWDDDLTAVPEPTTEGIFGGAIEFDGDNDYIKFPNISSSSSSDNSFYNEMTGELWVWFNNVQSEQVIVSHMSEENAGYQIKMLDSAGDSRFRLKSPTTDQGLVNTDSTTTAEPEQWYHIAWTQDEGNNIKLYINGNLEVTNTVSSSDITDIGQNLILGASNTLGTNFNGRVDNFSIYNSVKTEEEIEIDYNRRNPHSMGWGDGGHDYGDPPAPGEFNTLTLDNSVSCEIIVVEWETSDWAETYSYYRNDNECDSCNSCTRFEHTFLDSCNGTCILTDTELSSSTGYCYTIKAHNQTDSTDITDNPLEGHPAPQWISTTSCAPPIEGMGIQTNICGKISPYWEEVEDADGYNIYRDLIEEGNCTTIGVNAIDCELIGHLGEGMDYDIDNDDTRDLIAHWKMNESSWDGTGDEVKDSSLNSNHGASVGDATTTDGYFNNAGVFDGDGDSVSVPHNDNLNVGDNFTFEAWIYPDNLETDMTIISKDDGSNGYAFTIKRDGLLNLWLSGTDISTTDDIVSEFTTFTHVAVVKNEENIYFYADGELKESSTEDYTTTTSSNDLTIGEGFYGQIDNVAMYNLAKSAEQIKIDSEAQPLTSCLEDEDDIDDDGNVEEILCQFDDKRIIPYTDYYYYLTTVSELGESGGSDAVSGQTSCFPSPKIEEQ